MRQIPAALTLILGLALAGCTQAQMDQWNAAHNEGAQPPAPAAATPPPPPPAPAVVTDQNYRAVSFDDLPGWNADQIAEALPAFKLSCTRFSLLPQDQKLGGSGIAARLGGKVGDWMPACTAARSLTPGDAAAFRAFLQQYFTPYQLNQAGDSQALLTGYYEPEVAGSLTATKGFATPLLARPRDLVQVDLGQFDPALAGHLIYGHLSGATLTPYFTRSEIEAGALKPQKLELLYLASPIDAFFMQIQGSGRVKLPNGQIVRVAYAGKNGLAYVPIGKILVDQGDIPADQLSMQTIHAWLTAHPDRATALMDQNPSYVFFRIVTNIGADQGPPGQLGVALTPGRSLAVDREVVPLGAPMWMASSDPLDQSSVNRLMLAQDVGSAINGPLRADVFYGAGAEAANRAGRARQGGTLYLLLPKE